ncbi:MAG: hypothetical protein FJ276_09710 [Planctomycetes bacterium]|nr:hypothetical protein [Planctomycetota bacterium]
MKTCLWAVALAAVVCVASITAPQSTATVSNLEELRQQRKEAAHRKRRIIYNNDGDDLNAFIRECKQVTPDEFLSRRTSAVAGTQVDTIFYCTGLCFGILRYDSKVGDNHVRIALEAGKLPREKAEQFFSKKLDAMQMMINFCRKNKIEIFCSMRMNDTHDGSNKLLFSTLKKAHPEYLNGTPEKPPKFGVWSAVDYARPEIRDLRVRMFQEACENYDLDGIEMDYFRHAVLFKSHATGTAVSQEERDMMTDMMRRIRRMTEEVGLKRGRPILVAVRVPDSVGYCEAMGLELARWLEEGLVDILIPGGYFRLNSWETSVELGHKHGVPVYPSLDESRMSCNWPDKNEAAKIRNSPACYRARAAEVWDSGADGVYMFNFFDPHSPLWQELGDPKTLSGLDAVYTTSARSDSGIGGKNGLVGGRRFLNRRVAFCPERPLKLMPGRPASVDLRVGQHVGGEGTRGLAPEVTLQLRVKDLASTDELAVKLSGQSLVSSTRQAAWLEYPVKPALVVKGTNRFEITLKAGSTAKPVVEDLLLWVRYGKTR